MIHEVHLNATENIQIISYNRTEIEEAIEKVKQTVKILIDQLKTRKNTSLYNSIISDIDDTILKTDWTEDNELPLDGLSQRELFEMRKVKGIEEEIIVRLGVVELINHVMQVGSTSSLQPCKLFFVTARPSGKTNRIYACNQVNACWFDDYELYMFPGPHPLEVESGDSESQEVSNDNFTAFKEVTRSDIRQCTNCLLEVGDRAWDCMSQVEIEQINLDDFDDDDNELTYIIIKTDRHKKDTHNNPHILHIGMKLCSFY